MALAAALTSVAARHGVPCSDEVIAESLHTYADFFFSPDSHVQLRLARHSSQGSGAARCQLNFRAEVLGRDAAGPLLRGALDSVAPGGGEVASAYMRGVADAFAAHAVAIDVDPAEGPAKLWHFGSYSVGELCELGGTPSSLQSLLPFLRRHCLTRVLCTGVDFHRQSVNVYFRLHAGSAKDEDDVVSMLEELGLAVPSDSETRRYITGPGTFAVTLRWDSAAVERACFYIAPPVLQAQAAPVLAMPGYIKKFMDDCALPHSGDRAHPHNSCFVSCSFGRGPDSLCLKQESDWSGSYHDFLHQLAVSLDRGTSLALDVAASKPGRLEGCLASVRHVVTAVLGRGSDVELQDDTPLFDAGLDSATAAFIRGQLAPLATRPLPGAVAFERPTIAALAAALVADDAPAQAPELETPQTEERPDGDFDAAGPASSAASGPLAALPKDEQDCWALFGDCPRAAVAGTSADASVVDEPCVGAASLVDEPRPGAASPAKPVSQHCARVAHRGPAAAGVPGAGADAATPPPAVATSPEPAGVATAFSGQALLSGGLCVRPARDDDWEALAELWRRHHDMRDSVPAISRALLTSSISWCAMGLVGAAVHRKWSSSTPPLYLCACLLLGFAGFVAVQHVVRWISALLTLEYDLRCGDLTCVSWKRRASDLQACAPSATVLVAEVTTPADRVVGVVCINVGPRWEGCCQRRGEKCDRARRKRAEPPATASLWNAAVLPAYRNRGVAAALLRAAQKWSLDAGASHLETVCLSVDAKAACWNSGFELWNIHSGRFSLVPAVFSMDLKGAALD